jgi:Zn-dependent peptidase ImmA (M78 family)
VTSDDKELVQELRRAGLSTDAINAAWPRWWSDNAANSPSAQAELRFTLARRLGIAPKPLAESNKVEFVWRDHARFKHLRGESEVERAILTSYGESIATLLTQIVPGREPMVPPTAQQLRSAILERQKFVDLQSLLATCWALSIPVIHLRIFPLAAKSMHAMVVRSNERYSILLGRDAQVPAPIAFTLAHELAHIALGHLSNVSALVEVGEPGQDEPDREEIEADRYALELLTGRSNPEITTSFEHFNARELAAAVLSAGEEYRIEPGTLALCLAYRTRRWQTAQAALQYIYSEAKPVWREINKVAIAQIEDNDSDAGDYLRVVMGLPDE